MIDLSPCETEREVEIFFKGLRQGAHMMLGFENKKNVNTGAPLTFEEMLSDINIFEENAKELVRGG